MEEKHVGESNLRLLINWVRRLLSSKLDSVTNSDDSIKVTDRRRLSVKVSPASGNRLQVKNEWGEKGLYVPPAEESVASDAEVDEMIVEVFGDQDETNAPA
jgi:hypothetical protein